MCTSYQRVCATTNQQTRIKRIYVNNNFEWYNVELDHGLYVVFSVMYVLCTMVYAYLHPDMITTIL